MTVVVRALTVVCFAITMFVAAENHDRDHREGQSPSFATQVRMRTYWHFTYQNLRSLVAMNF